MLTLAFIRGVVGGVLATTIGTGLYQDGIDAQLSAGIAAAVYVLFAFGPFFRRPHF